MSSTSSSVRPVQSEVWPVLCFLVPLAAVALVACGSRPDTDPIPRPTDILLITVDTLRADHMSVYGYPRLTSPNIDRLATRGVRFEFPIVQWPKTGPSFASMFTATYAKDNGIVRQIGIPVPDEMTLLAERLAEAGYAARAVVANGALARELGFHQGFEEYLESWRLQKDGRSNDPNGATRITDLALRLAEDLATARREGDGRPYFLWVHYLDPHFPYSPPEPFTDLFQGDEHWQPEPRLDVSRKSRRRQMTGIGHGQVLDGRDELAFYVARYDAEIAYTDHEIGRLLAGVEALGLHRNALTVLTSDHGESLGEHQYYFDHGRFGFQTCLRVPLIFHFPGTLTPQVDSTPVELLDLAPTLLDFAGIATADGRWMFGRSLTARLLTRRRTAGDTQPSVFSEAGYGTGGNWQRIVQKGRHKLILTRNRGAQEWLGGIGIDRVLYDLQADPMETRNVADSHPEAVTRLTSELRRWLRSSPAVSYAARDREVMDEETRRQLRALGYLSPK